MEQLIRSPKQENYNYPVKFDQILLWFLPTQELLNQIGIPVFKLKTNDIFCQKIAQNNQVSHTFVLDPMLYSKHILIKRTVLKHTQQAAHKDVKAGSMKHVCLNRYLHFLAWTHETAAANR